MIFVAQHARDNGRGTRLHQLRTISRVYISLTVTGAFTLACMAVLAPLAVVMALLS
jgi:hypothetical protein